MKFTYRQIWLINLPVMVSLLMEQVINLTDSIFLGRVGHIELGASAIAAMYYMVVYMLGFGFSIGTQVVIARLNGEGRTREAGKAFFQGLYFLSVFAIAVFVLSKLFSPALLRLMISSDDVWRATVEYIGWRDYSYLFAFPLLAIRAFFIGTTRTKILTFNAVVMVACNVAFNWLLIFGRGGFPQMGIGGAALGSSLAALAGLLFMVLYMQRRVDRTHYDIQPVFDLRLSLHLLGVSVWTMVRQFFCTAPWFLFFLTIEHLGEVELAAANVVRSVSMIFFVIVISFATTMISLTGNLIGAGLAKEIAPTGRRVIALNYMLGLPLIALALAFSGSLLKLFTADAMVVATAFTPLCVMLSTFLVSVPGYTWCNTVIGTGDTRAALVIQMITIAVYLCYLFLLSRSPGIPLAVYWTAEQLYVLMLFLLSMLYLKRGRRTYFGSLR